MDVPILWLQHSLIDWHDLAWPGWAQKNRLSLVDLDTVVASFVTNSDCKGVTKYYTKEEEAYLSILDTALTLLSQFTQACN